MIEFVTALKARIPFVGVQTDDPVHVKMVVGMWAGKLVQPLPPQRSTPITETYIYYTEDAKDITSEWYRKLTDAGATCVVINLGPTMLVLDTGVLPTPSSCYSKYLNQLQTDAPLIGPLTTVLQGLSLRTAQEVLNLTMARSGSLAPKEVRKTRQLIQGTHPGLTALETDYDFYDWPKDLLTWVKLNEEFFSNPSTPAPLVPRGLMFAGEPGTGKSMAARVLAKRWDIPLFRLDVATSLNRYLGVSERTIDANLTMIEQSAPCVWLLDEAEKLFGGSGDEGTTQRILSQLLWWLQHHKVRVLTIMTTNNKEKLPKELYREERIDQVFILEKMSLTAAKEFAAKVYVSVLQSSPSPSHVKKLRELLEKADKGTMSPAEVRALVYSAIKVNGWLEDASAVS